WHQPIDDWKAGLISSKECFSRCCEMTVVTEGQFNEFADQQQIDPYFIEFVKYCDAHGFPITVLSDGMKNYIERILDRYGLGNLTIHSNHLIFENGNKIRPQFPYFGLGCPNCANCKGYHIDTPKQGELIVYIGDGLSDRCGAKKADIIFAKDDLKTFCIENNISYFEYENFGDILRDVKRET
ncbi:HAD-IB family phosphatase, partial [candidate division KSB1 bacterium]|nr:HAD-IB family phosphatase [candidate division KSB1 bacterium]